MVKKTFVRARLVKSSRWHVDFYSYDPATGEEKRQRKDFDLNDIEDLTVREAVGVRLARYIDLFVPEKPAKTVAALGAELGWHDQRAADVARCVAQGGE